MSDFQNFMKKKLGGKYPVAEGQHLANPYFDPTVHSTPVSARASDGGGARRGGGGGGRRVTNLLLKQNLTRQQLRKAYPTSRTDKILKLSKAHTDYNEGELLGKGNETPYMMIIMRKKTSMKFIVKNLEKATRLEKNIMPPIVK